MNAALPSLPARILKRAEVDAALARPAVPEADASHSGAERVGSPAPPATAARRVAKEARLVPGAPGKATVEVRCSCGEWTRLELGTGDGAGGQR